MIEKPVLLERWHAMVALVKMFLVMRTIVVPAAMWLVFSTTRVNATQKLMGFQCPSGVCQNGLCSASTCNGSTCSSLNGCGENCFCFETSSGDGFCGPGTSCAPLADCNSSSDCPQGTVCATGTCCGRNVCLGAQGCDSGVGISARALFGRNAGDLWTSGQPPTSP